MELFVEVNETLNGKISVKVPYRANSKFYGAAMKAGARWDKEGKCYIFDKRSEPIARKLLMDVYGMDGTFCELINIKITAKRRIVSLISLELLTREIVKTNGQNKDARLGDGVDLLSGNYDKAVIDNKLRIVVEKGTELIMYDMPKTVLNGDSSNWKIELYDGLPNPIDIEKLIAELKHIKNRESQIIMLLSDTIKQQ
jgi:hypothetical protein